MPLKIAINGFGRIGRTFFKQALEDQSIEMVAINDLGELENLAYLLRYDTVYGRYNKEVGIRKDFQKVGQAESSGELMVGGRKIFFFQEREPGNLPWGELEIDVVVESTGVFSTLEKSRPHLDAGAKRVVITAPAKDDLTPTATPNVGTEHLAQQRITSNASCTTNAATPVVSVMGANPGIIKGMLNTVHGYTATQGIVDGPNAKDFRRGRAAAQNIVPSSTGAAKATEKAIPWMKDKFDGIAMRVPVVSGSIVDFTFLAKRRTSAEEINDIFRGAAKRSEWQGILGVTEEPLVSSDILKNPHGSLVDLNMTRVVDGDLVKVLSWYDNEWGYCSMLLKHVLALENLL